MIFLFQLGYILMQVGLRRAINDGAIVVERIPGTTHLNLREVAGRRIWRLLKR